MAKIEYKYFSSIIQQENEVQVIAPFESEKAIKRADIIYLLHGLGGSGSDFLTKTNIHNYAIKNNLIVIMPNSGRSFYTNMKYGYDYYDMLVKELPLVLKNTFRIDFENKKKYIIGISMGGYGAFKIAFNNRLYFDGIGSISGSVDIVTRDREKRQKNDFIAKEWSLIFGDRLSNSDDLFKYNLSNFDTPIYIACGKQDHLFEHNMKFYRHLNQYGCTVNFVHGDYGHNWDFFGPMLIQTITKLRSK